MACVGGRRKLADLEVPVLIVGSSLVGMSTALLLGHHGIPALAVEHHVTENLENDWTGPAAHRDPLHAFFAREIAVTDAAWPVGV